jgi:hypothetical protein
MTRIQLRIYVSPREAEIIFNVRLKDGSYEKSAATVDTGAAVSLFPRYFLDKIEHRLTEKRGVFMVEQAGIANQSFEAVEASMTLFFEDGDGHQTEPFEIPVWFADSDLALIEFAGVLDRSVLHIDMLQLQGWLEVNR